MSASVLNPKEEPTLPYSLETKALQLIARRGIPITLLLYVIFSVFAPKFFDFVEKRFYEMRADNQRILDVHQKTDDNQLKILDQMHQRMLERMQNLEASMKAMCRK